MSINLVTHVKLPQRITSLHFTSSSFPRTPSPRTQSPAEDSNDFQDHELPLGHPTELYSTCTISVPASWTCPEACCPACKNILLPNIILPGCHPIVEQPSSGCCQLHLSRFIQKEGAGHTTPLKTRGVF